MGVDDRAERSILPTALLKVSPSALPWYEAIGSSLQTFPGSNLSLTSQPIDERVQVEARGSQRDIQRFRNLTAILSDALSKGQSDTVIRTRLVERLDLMATLQSNP